MTRRLVVIGNGMAATRLVQQLVERDPARFAITVVGDEPHRPITAFSSRRCWQVKRRRRSRCCRRSGIPGTGCLRSGEAVDEVDIQQRRLRIAETAAVG